MKIVLGFLTGAVAGALLALALMLLNPAFDGAPIDDDQRATLALTVAGQGAVTVMQSSSGYPWIKPQPASARPPMVEGSRSRVAVMLSSTSDADTVVYITRIASLSQAGRPLFGEVIEHSLWHVVVPEKGSFIVTADDDLWGFARQTAVPLLRGEQWRGRLAFDTTIGPRRGKAEVLGVSGEYRSLSGSATLSETLRGVSLSTGVTDAQAVLQVNL